MLNYCRFPINEPFNWGEPKQAPHKSYIRENRCTYVCVYVCMYVGQAIRCPCAHHVTHTHYAVDTVKIVSTDHVLTISKCSLVDQTLPPWIRAVLDVLHHQHTARDANDMSSAAWRECLHGQWDYSKCSSPTTAKLTKAQRRLESEEVGNRYTRVGSFCSNKATFMICVSDVAKPVVIDNLKAVVSWLLTVHTTGS